MAIAMRGLRVKPSYEQLINVAVPDGLEQVKFPNRNATLFLRNGFVLLQLDGDGMRVMEDQQKRHIKAICIHIYIYIYMDSALRSLASDRSSDSVSNLSFKSAHTQNTATEGTNAMLTERTNSRKAEFYDLSGNEVDTSSSPSSDEQKYSRNHIHIDVHFNSTRDLQNESILRELGAERRNQDINDNNTMVFKENLLKSMVNMRGNMCKKNSRLLMMYYIRYKPQYHHLIHLVTTNQNRYFLKIL